MARYKSARAYDPAILLKIILFAYSKGMTSSRVIERLCREHVVFKALSADSTPHFTTIASFVSSLATEITRIFRDVLLVCDEAGLIGKEMFAVDGINRFSLRGRRKVNGQWLLFCLAHNIGKVQRHGSHVMTMTRRMKGRTTSA